MLTKIAKALVAGLVLTSVSLTVAGGAYAAPTMTHQQEEQWFNRSSNPNTNGF